ncbi:MAG: serine protease [Nitriliruptoraceae bacterium]|jgi:serine protease
MHTISRRTSQPRPSGVAVRAACAVLVTASLIFAVVAPAYAATDPRIRDQWGLAVVGAQNAWGTGQGAGVTIAIVDSGVDLTHVDLMPNLVAGYDFVDNDTTPQDANFHGTHVAGIAAAVLGNGRGGSGVAPEAKIMPVRVLDKDGRGSVSDVEKGVRWAVDQGADVVNLSLGSQGQALLGSGLGGAIGYAWSKGVVVVVAAGNEFIFSSGFSEEPAIVVSATTVNDQEPDYSSGVGNAKWGMAAPGGGCALLAICRGSDDVLSTYWTAGTPNTYAYLQGTSMAAPHVAGAAAVLLGLGLTPQQTVERLLETAKDIGATGRDSTFGAGRLDLAKAVAGLSGSSASKPSQKSASQPEPQSAPQDAATPIPASTETAATGQQSSGASTSADASTAPAPAPARSGAPGPVVIGEQPGELAPSDASDEGSGAPDATDVTDDADVLIDASGTDSGGASDRSEQGRAVLSSLALLLLLAAGISVRQAHRTHG